MIADRNSYVFVDKDTLADIKVDGGIMPARWMADEAQTPKGSTKNVLRGEDIAFLLESECEHWYVSNFSTLTPSAFATSHDNTYTRNGTTRSHYSFDRVLDHERPRWVAAEIHRLVALSGESLYTDIHFCKLPSGTLAPMYGLTGAPTRNEIANNYGIAYAAQDLHCSAADFTVGGALKGDPIRKLFYDMQMLRYTIGHDQSVVSQTTSYSCTSGAIGTNPDTPSILQSGTVVYEFRNTSLTGTTWENYAYWARWTASAGTYTGTLPSGVAPFVSGVRYAWLYLVLTDGTGATYGGFTYRCLVPVSFSYAGGVVTMTAAQVSQAVSTALAHYGIAEPTTRLSEYGGDRLYYVTIEDIYAMYELGDHTDISGIGWTWTPTS